MSSVATITKAHCPDCGGERNAFVRAEYAVHQPATPDDPTEASTTCRILQCCGCERVFFRRDHWFSEWDTIGQDPRTGEARLEPGVETTYWPSPVRRSTPGWMFEIEVSDRTLGQLLTEMYSALNADLRVLAAIGARTVFDRSSELLGVAASLTFDQKLTALVDLGKIGAEERVVLGVLVDAGSAAAHRGWSPSAADLSTMMDVVEAFLHRAFVLGEGIKKLRATVPARPSRAATAPSP